MKEKTTLILHRKSANRPEVKEAVKNVIQSGISLRVRIPWNKKDKARVVSEALDAGAERVIAGGGDGTINAVANALVGEGKEPAKAEMGILPLGTANDFARGCGLPVKDLQSCLTIACTGEAQASDVGRMNNRNFINVASLGFGAEVTATTPQDLKKTLGGAAYSLMGFALARKFEPYKGRIIIPGSDSEEGEMLIGAVGNNCFAGGGFEVAPKASMTDGLLDLMVISHDADFKVTEVVRELNDPFNEGNRYVHNRQLSEFTIECEDKLFCNLDGEPVRKKKLRFSVLPGYLKVVMPQL